MNYRFHDPVIEEMALLASEVGASMAVYNPAGADNVHIDVILSNISVAWPNAGFVGSALFPVVNVQKQANKYDIFGREAWQPEPFGDIRAPGTLANEIPGLNVSTDTYFCDEHSLQIPVTDEERDNADSPLSPDRDGTELVTSKILLTRELAIYNLVSSTGIYNSALTTTLSGTSQWNDYVNSNPISDMRTAVRAVHGQIFLEPNLAIIPYLVMSTLEDHPDFIERIKYSERGIVTPEIIADIVGIPNVIVPGVGYNATANPGQSASLTYLWGKNVILAYVPPRPGLKIPAFGYEFVWGYGGNLTQAVERWREQQRKADIIRVSRRYSLKIVAQDSSGLSIAGYLIQNAIA
jgi:hypothetical protein